MILKKLFNSKGSLMTEVQRELYLSRTQHLDFTYGYPERINPAWIKKLQTNIPKKVFQDEHVTLQYIKHIEGYFQHLFHAENIYLTPTAGFAFAFMCDALIEQPGDEIIIQDVSFEPYPKVITSYKGTPVVVNRDQETRFSLSLENIKNACTSRTKALVIVNPDNPLGLIYGETEMKALVRFCAEKNITLVVDYTFFQVSPYGKPIPLFTDFPESRQLSYIIIGDTGKILGLKGAKFGALLCSQDLKDVIEKVVSEYFFQHNQYNLYLISTILTDQRFHSYLQYLNKVIADNYAHIKQALHPSLKLRPFEATVFCLIDIDATSITDVDLTSILLLKGIGVIPLSDFYYDGNKAPGNYIRVSLARPHNEIKKFVEVLNSSVD